MINMRNNEVTIGGFNVLQQSIIDMQQDLAQVAKVAIETEMEKSIVVF